MDGVISPVDQQNLVSSFLEIAVGQTVETARQFLEATSWKLEEAIQLFYLGNEGGVTTSSVQSEQWETDVPLVDQNSSGLRNDWEDGNVREVDGDDVRPPLPVIRDVLYDNAISFGVPRVGGSSHEAHSVVPFRNFEEEMRRSGVWETGNVSSPTVDGSRDNLASLYRPPFGLMFHGPFEKAKDSARTQNKWLLVNLQSTREFSSHMLNRDTWANEAVAQTIKTNFIFWQVYNDTEEGSKVCTYYKLDSIPVIMVIDPVTGQKMRSWRGMVQPETLLEDLLPFMDGSPTDHHVNLSHKRPRESSQAPPQRSQVSSGSGQNEEDEELQQALAASMEGVKDIEKEASKETETSMKEPESLASIPAYPRLPEEPKGDRSLLCRVGVRLPDGRRIQRNFLRTDPIQLLWSFCVSQLDEEEAKTRRFRLAQAIPGFAKCLEYDANISFEESGLANSIVSVTWE